MTRGINFSGKEFLEEQYVKLEKENEDLRHKYTKLESDKELQIKGLMQEIENGKIQLSRMKSLEDQHQQDCIRINELTVTVSVLSRLYSNLRKTAGLD